MDGGLGTCKRLASLHVAGEEGEIAKNIPGTYDATDSNPRERFVADAKETGSTINPHHRERIGTWNVRTLCQAEKLGNAIQKMDRCGISALGIVETFWTSKGHFTTASGELVIYSEKQEPRAGVRVVLSEAVSNSRVAYRTISDGVLYIHIGATPFNISFIKVYVPNPRSCRRRSGRILWPNSNSFRDLAKSGYCARGGRFQSKSGCKLL